MKYGLIVHQVTKNVGDDIQALATSYFLPKIDYIINRERLDSFTSDKQEPVAVLMPGWYLWNKWNWPPSEYIVPKFISFHYSNRTVGRRTDEPFEELFLTGLGKDYMNVYGPIGARDYYTQEWLKNLGIKTYFSSCITTTLPNMPETSDKGQYICFVDVKNSQVENVIESSASAAGIQIKKITHNVPKKFFKESWTKRKKRAEQILTTYQNARCVITTRLHCALPCLAMGVPVLLVSEDESGHRFIPFYDWLHVGKPSEIISGSFKYDIINPPANKSAHIPYREELIKNAKTFVEEVGKPENLSKYQKAFPHKDLMAWRHDNMKKVLSAWGTIRRKEYKEIVELKKTKSNS